MVTCGQCADESSSAVAGHGTGVVEPRLAHLKSLPYTAIWREDTTCPRALPRSLRDVDQRDRTRALYLGHLVISRHFHYTC